MIILTVTTTKPNSLINFYQDIDVMNHVLNEYVLPSKLVAITRTENEGLRTVTTLKFPSKEDYDDFRNDSVIQQFGITKKKYNEDNGIVSNTEIDNGQNS
jgi:hypothetical protein